MSTSVRNRLPAILLATLLAAGVAATRLPPERAADFTFINGPEPKSLDPHLVAGQPEGRLVEAFFERLVRWDPVTLEPRPGLAERWEVDKTGTRYTFHLREATWSDGVPIKADTVVRSWRRLLDPATAGEYSYQLFAVKGAEAFATGKSSDFEGSVGLSARDDRTLVVELVAPTPYFLHLCGFYPLAPVPLHAIDRHGSPGWTKPGRLVASGPYTLGFRRLRDRVRLVKNDRYHAADSVRLTVIDALAIDSSTTALALYETAEVDWTSVLPPFAVRELAAMAATDLVRSPELTIGFYRLNTTRPPLDDDRVRRALAMSIDRRPIVNAVFGPGEEPSWSFVPAGIAAATGYRPPEAGPEDVAEARRLLESAGFPGGRGFPRITITFNADEGHQMMAELVQSQWKERLGIDVGLEAMEWGSFLDAIGRLDYWVGRAGWGADYVDPNTFLDLFTTAGPNNQTGFSSPRYDSLIALAATLTDRRLRNEAFREAESILLEQFPVIPLYVRSSRNLVAPWVKGFTGNPLDWHPLDALDVDRPARDAAKARRGHERGRR